jgi:hypothetical protein
MSPNCTMRSQPVWPDVGREHLDRGVPVLDRLGQRIEDALRQFAVQQQVEAVIAITGAGPLAFAQLDRLLKWLVRRARREIEQGGRAAIEGGAADLLGRRAQEILVAAGERDRRAAMDVRIDTARHDELPGGIDDPGCADLGEASRRSDRGDLAAGDGQIGRLRAARQNHGAAGDGQVEHRFPRLVTQTSDIVARDCALWLLAPRALAEDRIRGSLLHRRQCRVQGFESRQKPPVPGELHFAVFDNGAQVVHRGRVRRRLRRSARLRPGILPHHIGDGVELGFLGRGDLQSSMQACDIGLDILRLRRWLALRQQNLRRSSRGRDLGDQRNRQRGQKSGSRDKAS